MSSFLSRALHLLEQLLLTIFALQESATRGWDAEAKPRFPLRLHTSVVLLDVTGALFTLTLLQDLVGDDFGGRCSSYLFEAHGLQPSFIRVHLALDLLYAGAIIIKSQRQARANLPVNVLSV